MLKKIGGYPHLFAYGMRLGSEVTVETVLTRLTMLDLQHALHSRHRNDIHDRKPQIPVALPFCILPFCPLNVKDILLPLVGFTCLKIDIAVFRTRMLLTIAVNDGGIVGKGCEDVTTPLGRSRSSLAANYTTTSITLRRVARI